MLTGARGFKPSPHFLWSDILATHKGSSRGMEPVEQVSRELVTDRERVRSWVESCRFCPKTSLASTCAWALVVASMYLVAPFLFFLLKVNIGSSVTLFLYFLCAVVLLSGAGTYILVLQIAAMLRRRGKDQTGQKAHTSFTGRLAAVNAKLIYFGKE